MGVSIPPTEVIRIKPLPKYSAIATRDESWQ